MLICELYLYTLYFENHKVLDFTNVYMCMCITLKKKRGYLGEGKTGKGKRRLVQEGKVRKGGLQEGDYGQSMLCTLRKCL